MIGDAKNELERLQEDAKARVLESMKAASEENEFEKMQEKAKARAAASLKNTLKEIEETEKRCATNGGQQEDDFHLLIKVKKLVTGVD